MLRLVLKDGEAFEAETFLGLVCAMKGATMFGDAKGTLGYVDAVQRRVLEMEGVALGVSGGKIDDRCESLVRGLASAGLAALEDAGDGLPPLARLATLCADVLYGGDLALAWPLLCGRMRLTRRERREVEERLGIGKRKP